MRVLIYLSGTFHHKNYQGLKQILDFLNYDYLFTNKMVDFKDYDIIYSPCGPIRGSYPNKFIYGPHFSVFPDKKLKQIQGQKAIYIQPSEWAKNAWGIQHIPINVFSFPVDINRFSPINNDKSFVFVYTKRRNPKEVEFVCNFLKQNNIKFVLFDYLKRYREEDYLNVLQHAKYGIIIDAHESQGFAIEEALSCNVPLLVWNVKTMNQEWNSRYEAIPCTTIPYFDERCGKVFYEQDEFIPTFNTFIENLNFYQPRKYIIENLSVEPCSKKFIELIKNIQ